MKTTRLSKGCLFRGWPFRLVRLRLPPQANARQCVCFRNNRSASLGPSNEPCGVVESETPFLRSCRSPNLNCRYLLAVGTQRFTFWAIPAAQRPDIADGQRTIASPTSMCGWPPIFQRVQRKTLGRSCGEKIEVRTANDGICCRVRFFKLRARLKRALDLAETVIARACIKSVMSVGGVQQVNAQRLRFAEMQAQRVQIPQCFAGLNAALQATIWVCPA